MRDTISTLLTTAAMFMRLKDRAQALRAFDHFVATVEKEGGCDTPEVVCVMESFVQEYKALGYIEQSEKLAAMVQALKAVAPDRFSPDGRALEEWERPEFGIGLPTLPYSIKASRAQPGARGLFIGTCVAIFVVGGMLWLSTEALLDALHINDAVLFLYLCSVPLGGFLACSISDRRAKQKGEQSWCRVTNECFEFSSPGEHCVLSWNEVSRVFRDREPGPTRGCLYPVTQVQGRGGRKVVLSTRYFRDEEVETLYRICKLQHLNIGQIR
jgi:hypothetical protein